MCISKSFLAQLPVFFVGNCSQQEPYFLQRLPAVQFKLASPLQEVLVQSLVREVDPTWCEVLAKKPCLNFKVLNIASQLLDRMKEMRSLQKRLYSEILSNSFLVKATCCLEWFLLCCCLPSHLFCLSSLFCWTLLLLFLFFSSSPSFFFALLPCFFFSFSSYFSLPILLGKYQLEK